MKIRPVCGKVLVKIIESPKTTYGGIIIPDENKDDRYYGIVEALGKEAFQKTKEVNPGDKVIYLKYHGDPIEIKGEKYRILDSETIIAVVEE